MIAAFAVLCALSARSIQPRKTGHATEAISTSHTQCPPDAPQHLLQHFQSAAQLYNISVVLTRAANVTVPLGPLWNVTAATAITLQAAQDTHCLAVRMPRSVARALQHVYLTSDQALDTTADQPSPQLCVCAAADPPPALPAEHPTAPEAAQCAASCDDAVTKLPLNDTSDAYMAEQWYMVALPERVAGGAQVQLAFVARPEHAFVTSAPYQLPVCAGAEQAGNVSAAACSESRAFWDEAMYGGPGMLSPSVLQSGAETARFALTVTAPPDLQLLWATHAEHVQALEGALGPLHAC